MGLKKDRKQVVLIDQQEGGFKERIINRLNCYRKTKTRKHFY